MAALDVNAGPVHDMILDLVAHHVAITSTLPVFEMDVPGQPSIQSRVLDASSPDTRTHFLRRKVARGDIARMSTLYRSETSPWAAELKKEMEFEYPCKGGRRVDGQRRSDRYRWRSRRSRRSARGRTAGGSEFHPRRGHPHRHRERSKVPGRSGLHRHDRSPGKTPISWSSKATHLKRSTTLRMSRSSSRMVPATTRPN